LPKVLGDSNQLLQVCLQLVANCLHLLAEHGGPAMTISTEKCGSICVLQFAAEPSDGANAIAADDSEGGLALSACQGILHEHRGQVLREAHESGAVVLRVELPVTDLAAPKPKEATVPVLWQSRPYA
jgi:nitrogen-specific signal transduction histidine kinase